MTPNNLRLARRVLRQSRDWDEFKEQLSHLTKKEKGDCFELLSEYVLTLVPKYASSLKNVWHGSDVPTKVRKQLRLPDEDEGIDLVAETNDGKYWAIQCKYREDETRSLTRKSLSTFTDLAFAICTNVEFALVCTTANRFSSKLVQYGERLGFAAGDVWRELDQEFFKRLHKALQNKAAPIKVFKPFPHQQQAIRKARKHFIDQRQRRGRLIHPCGTGKSLTAYWIARDLKAKRILIAVPSLYLIQQTLSEWARELFAEKQQVHWLAVCSDESVKNIQQDDFNVLTQDLGIRVHTDPKEVTTWLKQRRRGLNVVLTTYQSGKVTARAAKRAGITFDLAIMDEAHKTVGTRDGLFSHLLYEKNIPIKKRLFMTATQRILRGDSDRVDDMSNTDVYGDEIDYLSFKEALERDPPLLSDYKIVTMVITKKEIADLVKKNAYVRTKRVWNDEVEARTLASLIALRKAMKRYRIKHALSFHNSIASARDFADSQAQFAKVFPEYGALPAYHIAGNTPTAVRRQHLDDFKNEKKALVTNARCLSEGVDVPAIDCVLFSAPKRSVVDIVQGVGRALRLKEGKKLGYLVVPVIVDEKSKDVEDSDFSELLAIISAIGAHDARIIDYFKAVLEKRRYKGTHPISTAIPVGLKIDEREFLHTLQLQSWGRLERLSWRPFDEARMFVHGLGLGSTGEWLSYARTGRRGLPNKPIDIPSFPDKVYRKSGWAGMGDWLGTGFVATRNRQFRTFKDARRFARQLNLQSANEWRKYCKDERLGLPRRPDDIPQSPESRYADDGWRGFGDFLGTGNIAPRLMEYRDFSAAREFVRSLGLKTTSEWNQYCTNTLDRDLPPLPSDIPHKPAQSYADSGWTHIGDWLGTRKFKFRHRQFRKFEDARDFARSLELRTWSEWLRYCNGGFENKPERPHDIPSNPHLTYANDGWCGSLDWLGSGVRRNKWRTFSKARQFARRLGLKSNQEWRRYCRGELSQFPKKPDDIPASPDNFYTDSEWAGWGDWLGTQKIASNQIKYRSFSKARAFVRSLGLKSQGEWYLYCKGQLKGKEPKPNDIPAVVQRTYRNDGWKDFSDWLGTGKIRPEDVLPFAEARKIVREQKLSGLKEWLAYCKGELRNRPKKPANIPGTPSRSYKNKGWKGLHDWLGTANKK